MASPLSTLAAECRALALQALREELDSEDPEELSVVLAWDGTGCQARVYIEEGMGDVTYLASAPGYITETAEEDALQDLRGLLRKEASRG